MLPVRLLSPFFRIPASLGWAGCAWIVLVVAVTAGVPRHFTSSREPAYQRYASQLANEQRLIAAKLEAAPDDPSTRLRLVRTLRREYLLQLSLSLDAATGGNVTAPEDEGALRRKWAAGHGQPLISQILDESDRLVTDMGADEKTRREARSALQWAQREAGVLSPEKSPRPVAVSVESAAPAVAR